MTKNISGNNSSLQAPQTTLTPGKPVKKQATTATDLRSLTLESKF